MHPNVIFKIFLNFIWSKNGFFEFNIFMRFFEAKLSMLYVSWGYGWKCVGKGILQGLQSQKNLITVTTRTFYLDRIFDWSEGKVQKSAFSIFDILLPWGHFGSRSSPLNVCYWYDRWCVGNLGPYPFQTRYVWICIIRFLWCRLAWNGPVFRFFVFSKKNRWFWNLIGGYKNWVEWSKFGNENRA